MKNVTAVAAYSAPQGSMLYEKQFRWFFLTGSFPLKEDLAAVTVIPTTLFLIKLFLLQNFKISVFSDPLAVLTAVRDL